MASSPGPISLKGIHAAAIFPPPTTTSPPRAEGKARASSPEQRERESGVRASSTAAPNMAATKAAELCKKLDKNYISEYAHGPPALPTLMRRNVLKCALRLVVYERVVPFPVFSHVARL